MDDKVIVTHRGALNDKYGAKGTAKIRAALTKLKAADAKRGVKSRVVYLDDARTMKGLGAPAMHDAEDRRGAKAAIDGVYRRLKPDYLMILGADDVVPHQDLKNPVYDPAGDDDRTAWSDLPYCCDAKYSRDAADFVGPTRVVGRLPDLAGATEPSHLLALLGTATTWESRSADHYAAYFALSAASWKGSSRMSLDNIVGDHAKLRLSPPTGSGHTAARLKAPLHFINCHGGTASPEFLGQSGNRYPVAMETRKIRKKIRPGTVAAVECCYGAELYDSVTLGVDEPICQCYLRQGAYGYLGSTTIAYGPADGNGAADLLCQDFLIALRGGASLGRAALTARQQFVDGAAQMDPIDLKTLAQFCLLGDPSVHPVATAAPPAPPKGVSMDKVRKFLRSERRAKLRDIGEFLGSSKPTASRRVKKARPSAVARQSLARIAAKGGLARSQAFAVFRLKGVQAAARAGAKAASAPTRYHVAVGRPKTGRAEALVAVVAKELDGRIIDYRIYRRR